MAEGDGTLKITDSSFGDTIGSGVTLVDFWAEWCAPCRMQGPIMDKVAGKVEGKAKVGKLNVDENPGTASKFGITGIPTSILFKDGNEVKRFVGVQSEDTLTNAINSSL